MVSTLCTARGNKDVEHGKDKELGEHRPLVVDRQLNLAIRHLVAKLAVFFDTSIDVLRVNVLVTINTYIPEQPIRHLIFFVVNMNNRRLFVT